MAGNGNAEREPDVIAELKRLGRQLGQTLDAAWKSVERQKAEEELRAGARAFASEFARARTTRPSDMASRTRRSVVDGLRWMSAELESLADRFTPAAADAEEPPDEGERR
jgi:hypothetical protein